MTKSKSPADFKSRVAAYVALHSDPAYEAHPYDPFEDTTTPRRRQRRMSLKRVIAQARKAGVDATVTTRDGTVTLHCLSAVDKPIVDDDSSEWN
jgi:hypothetical protein